MDASRYWLTLQSVIWADDKPVQGILQGKVQGKYFEFVDSLIAYDCMCPINTGSVPCNDKISNVLRR